MLKFLLTQNLADEVTDVVSDNVNFWSWNTIVKYFEDSFPTVRFSCKTDYCDYRTAGWTQNYTAGSKICPKISEQNKLG